VNLERGERRRTEACDEATVSLYELLKIHPSSSSSYRIISGQIGARVAAQRAIERGLTILLGRIIDEIVYVGSIARILKKITDHVKRMLEPEPMPNLFFFKEKGDR
jgi:hypothetical protein